MSATLVHSGSLSLQATGLLTWMLPVVAGGNLKAPPSTSQMDRLSFSSSRSSSLSSSESLSEVFSRSSSASSRTSSDDGFPKDYVPDVSEMKRVFARFDENNDGKICGKDLHRFMGRLGIEMTEEEAKSMLHSIDDKADGYMDFKQFYSFYLSLSDDVGAPEEADGATNGPEDAVEDEDVDTLLQVFKVFDKDNDNFITAQELQEVLIKLGIPEGRNITNCELMIQSVDSNGDKKIDITEFRTMMCSNCFQSMC